jgi:chromate transporter
LWIFLGAPHAEALRGNQRLSAALAAITAAVVGVIANLAVFFAVHTMFSTVDDDRRVGPFRVDVPVWSSISPRAVAVAALAFWLLFGRRWSVLKTLGACALVGAAIHLATNL